MTDLIRNLENRIRNLDRELMRQALGMLDDINQCSLPPTGIPLPAEIDHVMEALRARLAQPEHKPADVFLFLLGEGELDGAKFGERHPTERGNYWWRKHLRAALAQPEPEWQGLTTAERKALWNATKKPSEFAEMIEAKLREKNV